MRSGSRLRSVKVGISRQDSGKMPPVFDYSPMHTKHLTCLLISLLPVAVALGAGAGGREAFYRCRGDNGQTYFGDSMPSQCQNRDTEVLSERGSVLRVIDGADSRVEKAKLKVAEDAARKVRQDAAMRDRMLVETYLSVEEIDRLRDQRMELLEAQIRIDEQNLAALKDRETRLLRQATRYLPYNTKANASPLPAHVAEEMVSVVNSAQITRDRIGSKQPEKRELQNKFASDIRRFRELKGLK